MVIQLESEVPTGFIDHDEVLTSLRSERVVGFRRVRATVRRSLLGAARDNSH